MINQNLRNVIFHLISLILGIINCVYHHWSDWKIAQLIAKKNDFTLADLYDRDITIFTSFYGPILTKTPSLIQSLILIVISGYTLSFLSIKLYQKQNPLIPILLFLIFWLLKYPMPIDYSTFQGLYRGLLAW